MIEDNEKIREIETLDDQAELKTLYTERAVRFINENKKNPFFLYLAHSMPHVPPLAAPGKFKGKSDQGLYGDTGGLREGKGASYEGGQRVACIMNWPDKIKEGAVCYQLASTIDILPTLAAIIHSDLPKKKIDGVNILPLLMGDENAYPCETFLYCFRRNSLEAVRKGSWKLVYDHPGRSYVGFQPGADRYMGKTDEHTRYQLI